MPPLCCHNLMLRGLCAPVLPAQRVLFRQPGRPTAAPRTPRARAPLACYKCERVAHLIRPVRGTERGMVRRASARSYAAVVEDTTADEAALADFLDTLKFDANGLLVASAQDVDTGAILMQAFANREAVADTLRRGKATFYSRSRSALWTKGETSNNFIQVYSVHVDCDRDSLIYLGAPLGPACHTGADTCFYQRVDGSDGLAEGGEGLGPQAALSTLFQLEATIEERRTAPIADGAKPSWTRKLLDDPELLCSKVREEADELARAWEDKEGKEAAASEMADVLYHAMVLLNKQEVPLADVCAVLRKRFGTSGIDEKAARTPK